MMAAIVFGIFTRLEGPHFGTRPREGVEFKRTYCVGVSYTTYVFGGVKGVYFCQ